MSENVALEIVDLSEVEVPAGPHTAASVPGAVDEDTPEASKQSKAMEFMAPIPQGAWVKLGYGKAIDPMYRGHVAYVLESTQVPCNDPECTQSQRPHTHQASGKSLVVQTRDQYSSRLEISPGDCDAIDAMGRDRITFVA